MMNNANPDAVHYSIMLLLPGDVDRRLMKWSRGMPGASWPSWGGHVTLVPSFTVESEAELTDRISTVCQHHRTFQLNLDNPVAEQDWTRPDYRAVMLTIRNPDSPGAEQVQSLQQELIASTADLRTDSRTEVSEKDFLPHVTLAIGIAEVEANEMTSKIRADGLRVSLSVERVWLIRFNPSGEAKRVTRTSFVLPGAVNIFAD